MSRSPSCLLDNPIFSTAPLVPSYSHRSMMAVSVLINLQTRQLITVHIAPRVELAVPICVVDEQAKTSGSRIEEPSNAGTVATALAIGLTRYAITPEATAATNPHSRIANSSLDAPGRRGRARDASLRPVCRHQSTA